MLTSLDENKLKTSGRNLHPNQLDINDVRIKACSTPTNKMAGRCPFKSHSQV